MIVAVIDLGSNSIKSLVATTSAGGGIRTLLAGARDARISTGLGQAQPRLSEQGMQCGLAAIQQLLAEMDCFALQRIVVVATSAVRDAANGAEFCERIRAATGHELRILSGVEEANLIGRGLTSDPALADLRDFYVFDLGGGSLECLRFRDRRIEQAVSLPLGCVRLTECCVPDPRAPFSQIDRIRIMEVCREVLAKSGFHFALPAGSAVVFSGGTITTVRAILAKQRGCDIGDSSPLITVATLRTLLDDTAGRSLEERKQIDGLPAARADVFPTALSTVMAVAEAGEFSTFRHSFHNLRYGLAAELLEGGPLPDNVN